jgi:CIC family chloride channel protein
VTFEAQNIVSRYVWRLALPFCLGKQDLPIEKTPVPPPKPGFQTNGPSYFGLNWLNSRARSLRLSEGNLFLLLAIVIGLFSGTAVVFFRMAIEWVRLSLLGSALAPSPLRVLLVPAGAGLVVGFLVQKFFPTARGSGVNQTKAAVYVFDGYVPFRTVIGKFLTCSLAIGSGQSLGPEDPSLQMGAGIASALGRRLKLSRDKLRLLAPVGAAAGLAAAFNAPISAVLFVIEEVIGTWSATALGAIVLAAVSSVVVMRSFLGGEPMFHVPAYTLGHPAELLAYALLGVVSGVLSLAFTKIIAYFRPKLRAQAEWTYYFQPAAAGLLIGFIGLRIPQSMGTGYPYIDQALHSEYTWEMLAVLGFAKIVSTSLSFISGTPGGMFAPVLFIGAMIGGAIGGLEHHFFPQVSASVAPFALVGMGTFFAGFLRVPITSVFMVVETSGSYSIVLPVMISNTIAYLISRKYQDVGLFDLLAKQDNLELPSMEEQREQIVLRVEDAMRKPDLPPLQASDTLARALEIAETSTEVILLVRFPTGRWAGLSRTDLHAMASQHPGETHLREILSTARLPILHPDQRLDDALRFIQGHELLPVVSRAASRKLEGVISLPDILTAYQRAS